MNQEAVVKQLEMVRKFTLKFQAEYENGHSDKISHELAEFLTQTQLHELRQFMEEATANWRQSPPPGEKPTPLVQDYLNDLEDVCREISAINDNIRWIESEESPYDDSQVRQKTAGPAVKRQALLLKAGQIGQRFEKFSEEEKNLFRSGDNSEHREFSSLPELRCQLKTTEELRGAESLHRMTIAIFLQRLAKKQAERIETKKAEIASFGIIQFDPVQHGE